MSVAGGYPLNEPRPAPAHAIERIDPAQIVEEQSATVGQDFGAVVPGLAVLEFRDGFRRTAPHVHRVQRRANAPDENDPVIRSPTRAYTCVLFRHGRDIHRRPSADWDPTQS